MLSTKILRYSIYEDVQSSMRFAECRLLSEWKYLLK